MSIGFSGNLVVGGRFTRDVDYPQIGYDNVLTYPTTSITTSYAEVDHPIDLAINGYTNDAWIGESGSLNTIGVTLDSAYDVNYIGIAAHNLHKSNAGFRLLSTDDGWSTSTDLTGWVKPSNDSPVMVVFDVNNALEYRIQIDAAVGVQPFVGVMYVGKTMQMERKIAPSFEPIALARDSKVVNNLSVGGNFVGRSIIRQGASGRLTVDNLTPSWVRSEWMSFIDHAERLPFFFGWALGSFPWEVAYCWTDRNIRTPSYSKPKRMKVTLDMKGLN